MDRVVALKVLVPAAAADADTVRRFERGARACGQVIHHNLVQVYDIGTQGDMHYASMEFVDGMSVAEMLEAQRTGRQLELNEMVELIRQVARALRRIHKANVVHRNVTPGTILVASDGTVKLTNMGLAKALPDPAQPSVTTPGMSLGVFNYVPPEQIYSAADVDHRADVYALGATFFTLVTGRPPFASKDLHDTLQMIRQDRIPSPKTLNPDLPDTVCQIIEKAMAKSPEDRYQTVDEMLRDLDRVRDAE